MLKVKQLKQRKIFEISLTESQIYKKLQTSAIIREISDSTLETGGAYRFDRKMRLGCRKHNSLFQAFRQQSAGVNALPSERLEQAKSIVVSDFPVYQGMAHPLRFESKKWGEFVQRESGTEKLVNGKQHSVWFVPTGMKGLPQNVLLNFRLEFPKSDLTIYLPSGISEIFCQMVSTPGEMVQNRESPGLSLRVDSTGLPLKTSKVVQAISFFLRLASSDRPKFLAFSKKKKRKKSNYVVIPFFI